jgi:hypothetical protein
MVRFYARPKTKKELAEIDKIEREKSYADFVESMTSKIESYGNYTRDAIEYLVAKSGQFSDTTLLMLLATERLKVGDTQRSLLE